MRKDSAVPEHLMEHPDLARSEWQLCRRLAGRHTELFELEESGNGRRRVFVKTFPDPGAGSMDPRLLREYRALSALHHRLGPDMRKTVPEPVGRLHERRMFVLTAVRGTPLSRLLQRQANRVVGSLRRRSLTAWGQAVGAWLRQFHSATERPPVTHDHIRFCGEIAAGFARLRSVAPDAGLAELEERMVERSSRMCDFELPAASRHGDFLPQNILILKGRVSVVDFETFRCRDNIFRDRGSLLAYLALLRARPFYSAAGLAAFEKGFEAGYGTVQAPDAQALFIAEAALRIARDSARPDIVHDLVEAVRMLHL